MENFKAYIRNYRDVDNQLNALNKEVYEKRAERKEVEDKMARILLSPEYSSLDKLNLEDRSYISIKRPSTYSKAWGISKNDLKTHLENVFKAGQGYLTANEIYDYIISEQSKKLVSTEFSFNRVVKE